VFVFAVCLKIGVLKLDAFNKLEILPESLLGLILLSMVLLKVCPVGIDALDHPNLVRAEKAFHWQ
jgi:hypothetical protein